MGYDLTPRKKDVLSKNGMLFTWPRILNETGACYLFGYGTNPLSPGQYIYNGSRGPGSPVSNDGFKVTNEEAKIMAKLFKGYVFVKRGIMEEWEKKTGDEKALILSFNNQNEPLSVEFINKVEELAEFCEQSGGFTID